MLPLSEILSAFPPLYVSSSETLTILHLTDDSRQVVPGTLFAAVRGTAGNGEAYIVQAVEKGAVAVITQTAGLVQGAVEVLVDDVRKALPHYASTFFAPQPETVIAVTGTDGKTSTVEFIRQMMERTGERAATVGTLGVVVSSLSGGGVIAGDTLNTSPGPVALHATLQQIAQSGVKTVALEASSHGLDQHRVDGTKPQVGVFTTFGSDHLDYHHTREAYFAAKALLFSSVMPEGGHAILNADDAQIMTLTETCKKRDLRVHSFGHAGKAVHIVDAVPTENGQSVSFSFFDATEWSGTLPLYGHFQVMNVAAALAVMQALHPHVLPDVVRNLPYLAGVPGRLECVARHPSGAPVFIDYAHTAQALEGALKALRKHTTGKLHVVFGCGGDRDKTKRPDMGRVAARLADQVIVTDDNPRTEEAATIRREVLEGCPDALEIGDRREAIDAALQQLTAGDILLVAGKGHETYQIIGTVKHHFNDAEEIRERVK